MIYILESKNMENYLEDSPYINFKADNIQKEVSHLFAGYNNEIEKIKAAFEFVRDVIPHSWDIKSTRITKTASEVLEYKEGICYSKSMLLAAMMRSENIPTGFCYQRLTLGETPETGYCIHALNAVYISEINTWVRIDSRGNTHGKNAQFFPKNPQKEQLGFPVRLEYEEIDYPTIFTKPLLITTQTLESNTNCLDMIKYHLPTSI